jgi:hypothetical protein
MKIKFYRNGKIKLMGYSAEVRLYGASQRGYSVSFVKRRNGRGNLRGQRGIKPKTVLFHYQKKIVISELSCTRSKSHFGGNVKKLKW